MDQLASVSNVLEAEALVMQWCSSPVGGSSENSKEKSSLEKKEEKCVFAALHCEVDSR